MASSGRSNTKALVAAITLLLPLIVLNWRNLEGKKDDGKPITENMPATLALTTQAIGPFRGLITNGLWWRAVRLQDEGDHFEAIQLANWIAALQPKLTQVWTWQGWNLAYNISAQYEDREEKWKWIMEGLSLLRDKGLFYNPRDAWIHLDIARIFREKIGNKKDKWYALRWAWIMRKYLPNGNRADIERLLAAAQSEDELMRRKGVRALCQKAEAVGLDLLDARAAAGESPQVPEAHRRLLNDPANRTALAEIRNYHSRRGLERKWGMNLKHMLFIDEKYGPFDWRLYHAHVVYWGADDSYNKVKGRETYQFPYHRQAMVDAFYNGQIAYMDDSNLYTVPNLALAEKTHEYLAEHAEHFRDDKGAYALVCTFHIKAVIILYAQEYRDEAREMYEDFKENFMTAREKRTSTFEKFIMKHAPDALTHGRSEDHDALVYSALAQAYRFAAIGDMRQARGYENMANLIWQRNQKQYAGNPKRRLPPLERLRSVALSHMLSKKSTLPPELQARLRKLVGGAKILDIPPPKNERPKLDLGDHHHDIKPPTDQ